MRSGKRPVVLLGLLVGALGVTFAVLMGLRLSGADSKSSDAATSRSSVQAVAEQVTLAFLDVDFRDMAPRVQRVLDQAAGTFYDEYKASEGNLIAAARQGEAISSGEVLQVGLSQATGTTARVLVAANSTVSNKSIDEAKAKGETVDDKRYYRFQLDLTLVEGSWRVTDLQFVP